VRFACVRDCNGCAGQCGEMSGGRMRMAEVCGGRARSPEASVLVGFSLFVTGVVFVCFSVLTMCYVWLRAFTGRVAVP
jgi:hypothetical protein